MSDTPPNHDLNFSAANELETQTIRAREILERLAANLAANDNGERDFRDLVDRKHVLTAAKLLFGSAHHNQFEGVEQFDVFISYAHGDETFVDNLAERLAAAEIRTFKANRSIQLGALWCEEIWKTIRGSQIFLPVITPRFVNSDWCKLETGAAVGASMQVLPIRNGIDSGDLPPPLSQYQAKEVVMDRQIDELITELKHRLS